MANSNKSNQNEKPGGSFPARLRTGSAIYDFDIKNDKNSKSLVINQLNLNNNNDNANWIAIKEENLISFKECIESIISRLYVK